MSSDTFSFECDLDQARPAAARAALSVQDDGEHIVFNVSTFAGDGGREVYLTPDVAANLAHLVASLADDADDTVPRTDDSTGPALKFTVVMMVVALVLGLAGDVMTWLAR